MKPFHCDCGHKLFFDSTKCVNCGRSVAFDPASLDMRVWFSDEPPAQSLCLNGQTYDVCNWLQASTEQAFCIACNLNRTIPNIAIDRNVDRWRRLEEGKKRLVYSLLQLGLPIVSCHQQANGLGFDFLEDERSDPERFPNEFHYTGYANSIITVNLLEADPAAREAAREAMNEQYRTVLGHMRHESGHFYFDYFRDAIDSARFEQLFGDVNLAYRESLDEYYLTGPPPDWPEHFISAYSSAHPLEDWAETWAHYLHITDALETAETYGLVHDLNILAFRERLGRWRELSVTLNELNRGFGVNDAYPFVISARAEEKLLFIDELIKSINESAAESGRNRLPA